MTDKSNYINEVSSRYAKALLMISKKSSLEQIKEDFQCLCNHCNLLKRQIARKTMETGKRYGATNIPSISVFGIDFQIGFAIELIWGLYLILM